LLASEGEKPDVTNNPWNVAELESALKVGLDKADPGWEYFLHYLVGDFLGGDMLGGNAGLRKFLTETDMPPKEVNLLAHRLVTMLRSRGQWYGYTDELLEEVLMWQRSQVMYLDMSQPKNSYEILMVRDLMFHRCAWWKKPYRWLTRNSI
jgi:hypothetical protein